jgi:hypothetical protein
MDYETHNGHTHPPEKEEPIFMAIMAARRLRETGKKVNFKSTCILNLQNNQKGCQEVARKMYESQLQVNMFFNVTKE